MFSTEIKIFMETKLIFKHVTYFELYCDKNNFYLQGKAFFLS